MTFRDANITIVDRAAEATGTPITHIGRALGFSPNYFSMCKVNRASPSIEKYADLLATCGYALVALPAEEVPDGAQCVEGRQSKGGKLEVNRQ